MSEELTWVPRQCTLPSAEQPPRVAEFDVLFASSLLELERPGRTVLRLRLAAAVEQVARELADRETSCCSFFTFTFARREEGLVVDVRVPAAQSWVLDALASRAASLQGSVA